MLQRKVREVVVGVLTAGVLFAVLTIAFVYGHRSPSGPASLSAAVAAASASSTPSGDSTPLVPSAVPTAPSEVPTAAPTALSKVPTARPTARPSPGSGLCVSADLLTHVGVSHGAGYQGDLNSSNAHPGDLMLLTGYPAFTTSAHGCLLPAVTARLAVLDPSGHQVSWWAGMSRTWPQMTAQAPSGCGCGTGLAPLSSGVTWICSSAGSCGTAPLGNYTLVFTLTLDSGSVISRATMAIPTSS